MEMSCPSGKPELKQMFPGFQFVLVFLRFSREFARDVMPSDGPGEVANFAALTVSLYTTSHHPPVSPDWVRGEQWTPWDSESVSCSRLPGSGSQGHTAVRGLNELRCIKHLVWCRVHSRCPVNITYCS